MNGFSGKHDLYNFDYHNFSDMKYLYFLCLGMFSFLVHLGTVLGLEPLEQTFAHVRVWHWDEVHYIAFDNVKATIARDVVLAYPDCSQEFEIYTDASSNLVQSLLTVICLYHSSVEN